MATTNFSNGVTLTDAGWFNDVDAAVYEGTLPTGATALTVTGATTLAVYNTIATTVNAFGAATTLNIGAGTGTLTVANTTLAAKAGTFSTTLGVTGDTTLTGDLAVNGGDVTTTASTLNIAAANATTVNAFGAASTALNIGHASAAAAFPGGISIPTGKTLSGAGAINISGNITGAAISGTTGAFSGAVGITNASDPRLTLTRGAASVAISIDSGGGIIAGSSAGDFVIRPSSGNMLVSNSSGGLVFRTSEAGAVTIPGALSVSTSMGSPLLNLTDHLILTAWVAPSGTANTARIFAVDNGSGKIVLKVQFPSGAAQQLAIEP